MHAVVILDKPKGITSQEAVNVVKKHFGVGKAGHAGALDPIATGVLLVCVGEATKITRFLSDLDKEYLATLKLGERTDTYDAEGKIIEKKEDFSVTEAQINSVLERFKGTIKQMPPMYSAVKVSGKPLYKLARRGIVVERKERTVQIYELSVTKLELPFLQFRVSCSKGTYIRSLCDDIGSALGTGAHMTELRRIKIGKFRIEDAATPEELAQKKNAICSIDAALEHLKDIILTSKDFSLISNGTTVIYKGAEKFSYGEYLRLKDPEGRLFGIGVVSDNRIKPERLFHLPKTLN
jgi:tRNA pseudouridine55 synthase